MLVPTLGTYVDQRQQIAALEASVAGQQEDVADLEAQRDRWTDPAYITTQARERLYYVKPGEVVYLVDNDLRPALAPAGAGAGERRRRADPHRLDAAARALRRRLAGLAPDCADSDESAVPGSPLRAYSPAPSHGTLEG